AKPSIEIPKQEPSNDAKRIRSVSPTTALLILDIQRINNPLAPIKITKEELVKKYALIQKNDIVYANTFILTDESFDIDEISSLGVLLGTNKGNYYTVLIPIENIALVAQSTG